ncbi:uncharacterized protein TrAtP1_006703 [Trichoderma atroviride]|uniref:uncharacterized protein n=1 Tax=Hypocrea atroviridis TaxID=63577 RepID=UPI00331E04CF|nr:hypothetical protein TrAtP1_006703 [Trichoderma atroviride]
MYKYSLRGGENCPKLPIPHVGTVLSLPPLLRCVQPSSPVLLVTFPNVPAFGLSAKQCRNRPPQGGPYATHLGEQGAADVIAAPLGRCYASTRTLHEASRPASPFSHIMHMQVAQFFHFVANR